MICWRRWEFPLWTILSMLWWKNSLKKCQKKNKVAARQFYFRNIHSFDRYFNKTVFLLNYTYHRTVLKGVKMKEIVISTDRITKTFFAREVIRDCQISVNEGRSTAFLVKTEPEKPPCSNYCLGFSNQQPELLLFSVWTV